MSIKFFCPRWGSENISWPDFFKKVRSAGYDGVEWAIPNYTTGSEITEVHELAQNNSLLLIAQHYETNDANFNRHFANYAAWLEKVKAFSWHKINSQTGKDYFSYAQNAALIKLAGKEVIHETHRGKFSFAAHVTQQFLETIESLRITLDISHWCNVAEGFLADQKEVVELAISRTDHIHARVGYAEGPQVPDPRAAEWQFALDHHLQWWDKVVSHHKNITITPEFGPYPYMVTIPGTAQPIADQWAINLYMMELLKKRYT
jgi:sugar phosphate isomerase/epimerase